MIERPRLLPAVILGAMGLLALKLLAWTAESAPGHIPPNAPLFAQASTKGANKSKPDIFDPETTGSVPAPDPKKEQEKKEAEAKAEAARAANPNNKAGLMNGAVQPVSPAEKAILERLGEGAIADRWRRFRLRKGPHVALRAAARRVAEIADKTGPRPRLCVDAARNAPPASRRGARRCRAHHPSVGARRVTTSTCRRRG